MEPHCTRRVSVQAAVVCVVVPMVLVLAFLSLFVLNVAVGAVIDAVQGPSDPFGDPNASSPVTGLRLGLAAVDISFQPALQGARVLRFRAVGRGGWRNSLANRSRNRNLIRLRVARFKAD